MYERVRAFNALHRLELSLRCAAMEAEKALSDVPQLALVLAVDARRLELALRQLADVSERLLFAPGQREAAGLSPRRAL